MHRNDASLYSGKSSSIERRKEEKRQRESQKAQAREKLLPAADKVLELVAEERKRLGEKLLEIVNPDTTDDQVLNRLQAIRFYQEYLNEFERGMRNILRPTNPTHRRVSDASEE